MNKLFLASALAITFLAASPREANAFWNSPQCCAGMGWLQCKALNCMPWLQYNGPLYNYGPYYGGYGYEDLFVRNPYCGAYVPAYPSTYYYQYGNQPSQWSTINPAPNYGQIPAMGAPANYYTGLPQAAPAQPLAQQPPIATPTPEEKAVPAITTSFRPLRNRLQR